MPTIQTSKTWRRSRSRGERHMVSNSSSIGGETTASRRGPRDGWASTELERTTRTRAFGHRADHHHHDRAHHERTRVRRASIPAGRGRHDRRRGTPRHRLAVALRRTIGAASAQRPASRVAGVASLVRVERIPGRCRASRGQAHRRPRRLDTSARCCLRRHRERRHRSVPADRGAQPERTRRPLEHLVDHADSRARPVLPGHGHHRRSP